MAKIKYYYDTKTLSYKPIKLNSGEKIKGYFIFFLSSVLLSFFILLIFYQFFDSPKEKKLKLEIQNLTSQYEVIDKNMKQVEIVLDEIQDRDDNIYRVIFEADPIPTSIRKQGFGGVNRYEKLLGLSNSELMINTSKKIDQLTKQLYLQSKSFDEVIDLAKNKSNMLASIPAIQPVANKDLKRMASGYGYRIHPIYKTRKMHYGMDFSASRGTPIYAPGNGVVKRADSRSSGYGRHIRIDHGFGYVTVYAHLNKYNVKRGQKVKRGDIIGYVGSTGRSVAPHLHYEIIKDGKKINPLNFYIGNLTSDEYNAILIQASQENLSLD